MSENTLTTEQSAYDVLSVLKEKGASKHATQQALSTTTATGDYLPYVKVMGSQTIECKRGEFPLGKFAFARGKTLVDIGAALVVMLLGWRPKAMQFTPKVVAFFDPDSEAFKDVAAKADSRDQDLKQGNAYGVEFLMWLPDTKEFAVMFFGSFSMRLEAPNLVGAIKKGELVCKLKCELVENKKKQSWHIARFAKHDLPISNQPPQDMLISYLDKFNNPKEAVEEPAELAEAETRG